MRFAHSKRALRLKTVDSCFQDLKDSRLMEETYTVDEVSDMLDGLQVLVRGEVELELINTAHTNVLLLRQLFSQAEKFYLRLQTDISELENSRTAEASSVNRQPTTPRGLPQKNEISRLKEDNDKLKARLRTLESQTMNALDDKSKAERALKDLQKSQGDQQLVQEWQQEGVSASARTVRQRLLEDGLVSRRPAKNPLLSRKTSGTD
uniref:Leucine zipper transcription factor-like protein 1 n=1 Tax=Sinocyclocheilus rhinocerous TaxID=307959 RepID=A0A673NNZ1_9TELE